MSGGLSSCNCSQLGAIADPCPSAEPGGHGRVHCHNGGLRTDWHVHDAGELYLGANPNPAANAGGAPSGGYLANPDESQWTNPAAAAGQASTTITIPAMTEQVAFIADLQMLASFVRVNRGRCWLRGMLTLTGAVADTEVMYLKSGIWINSVQVGGQWPQTREDGWGHSQRVWVLGPSCSVRQITMTLVVQCWNTVETANDFGTAVPDLSAAVRWHY